MQLNQLKPKHKRIRSKRIGRGGKKGASSGRGIKKLGSSQPRIRELLKRYPKIRGSRARTIPLLQRVVNVELLEKSFEQGQVVSPETLGEHRVVRRLKGRVPQVKILGGGKLQKSLRIQGCKVSKQAREKIEKAGGTILS